MAPPRFVRRDGNWGLTIGVVGGLLGLDRTRFQIPVLVFLLRIVVPRSLNVVLVMPLFSLFAEVLLNAVGATAVALSGPCILFLTVQ